MTETNETYQSLCRQIVKEKAEREAQRQRFAEERAECLLAAESVFLRDTQLAKRFGVQRQTVWRWTAQGTFPPPIKLSNRCTRWRLSDILVWELARGGAA